MGRNTYRCAVGCVLLVVLLALLQAHAQAGEPEAPSQPPASSDASSPSPPPPDVSQPSPALQVTAIRFVGVHQLSPKELKKRMNTKQKRFRLFGKARLDEKDLAEDLKRLEKYYKSQGFYHMRLVSHRIVPEMGHRVRLEIVIEEGQPLMVEAIQVQVDGQEDGPWHKEIRSIMPMKRGKRFTSEDYRDCEKILLRFFGDWGYPKAKVQLRARLDKSTNQGSVFLEVTTGPLCFFGPVTLEGNRKVENHVILRELTFHKGDRFSTAKVQESQRRLFNLSLFQLVDMTVEEMESDATELPVRVLLKESKKQTIRAGVGYGTEDQFRGRVDWEIRDFLGDGRRLQFDARASTIMQLLETNFYQPYLVGSRASLNTKVGALHEDQPAFENRKFYTSTMIDYKIDSHLSSRFGYNFEANRLLDVDLDLLSRQPADNTNRDFLVSSLLGALSWVQVDDPLNPKSGFQIFPNMEWASSALGSEVDFVKLSLEGRGYVPIGSFGTLAGKLLLGTIYNLENTESIPIFKRFFAGGSNSVRGYPYQKLGPLDQLGNPIGGLAMVEGSLETRFPLPFYKSLEGVLFFDFGNVYEERLAIFTDGLRYTSGCGVRYMTPIGPVRFDFGYELNPPDKQFFQPYQFYFSIGQAF
jgi:outer membrane protein assembly complex protein YaeT